MIKVYSDKTRKYYDTLEEATAAESEAIEAENRKKMEIEKKQQEEKERREKLAAERKARAAEVEETRKVMVEAQKKYKEALEAFCKDYGSYHYTTSSFDDIPTLFNFFQNIF